MLHRPIETTAVIGQVNYWALTAEEFFAGAIDAFLLAVELLDGVAGAENVVDSFDLNRGGV
jgi:hypothetical protein